MLKRWIIGSLYTMLIILSLVPGCSATPNKPTDADEIAETMFQAVLEEDYTTYRNSFSEDLQAQLFSAEEFSQTVSQILEQYGEYTGSSLKYSGFEVMEDELLKIYYKAIFSKDDDVEVVLICRVRNGETVVEGFQINP